MKSRTTTNIDKSSFYQVCMSEQSLYLKPVTLLSINMWASHMYSMYKSHKLIIWERITEYQSLVQDPAPRKSIGREGNVETPRRESNPRSCVTVCRSPGAALSPCHPGPDSYCDVHIQAHGDARKGLLCFEKVVEHTNLLRQVPT